MQSFLKQKTKFNLILCLILFLSIFFKFNVLIAQDDKAEINNKNFTFQNNYWIDADFIENRVVEVEYQSKAYNQMLADEKVKDYLALGENIKLNIDNTNFIITNALKEETKNNTDNKNIYAWFLIGIIVLLTIATTVIFIVSTIHKNKKKKN